MIPIIAEEEDLIPVYATEGAAGADVRANIKENVVIPAGEIAIIPTGIKVSLPAGYEIQVRPRSGLAAKFGVTVLNTPGTVDADYRGEIKVILINHGKQSFVVEPKMRIGAPSTSANDVNPGLAIDPSSTNTVVSWSSANGSAGGYIGEVYANLYLGGSWLGATVISSNASTQVIATQTPAAIINSSHAAVAWYDSGQQEVVANYYDGAVWSDAQPISFGITGTVSNNASVSMTASGLNVIAVWSQTVAGVSSIYSNYSSTGGLSWNVAQLVYNSQNAYNPTVTIDATGKAIAVWEADLGTGTFDILSASSSSGGSWSTETILGTSQNNAGMSLFSLPQVSMNSVGNAIASWTNWTSHTGPVAINYATYNGSAWSSAVALGSSDLKNPLVALNSSGSAAIVGLEVSSAPYTIVGFLGSNSGSSWSSSTNLITDAPTAGYALTISPTFLNDPLAAFIAPGSGADQIVQTSYGIASGGGPNPPTSLTGSRKTNAFPFQTENYNFIQWVASSTSGVTQYNVYRTGSQIGIVSANASLEYLDHNIERGLTYTYSVTAVDTSGESPVATIIISP